MAEVMRSDPEKFGGEVNLAVEFDRLLTYLGVGLIAGNTFRMCLDQPFDSVFSIDASPITVETIKIRLQENIDFFMGTIGTELETNEALSVVGQFGIYALYRTLTIRVQPDVKLFERMWRYMERLPMVVLFTKYRWFPDEFLLEYTSFPGLQFNRLVPRVC
jgi:WASH complex subunit 7, N-terminal